VVRVHPYPPFPSAEKSSEKIFGLSRMLDDLCSLKIRIEKEVTADAVLCDEALCWW
jgi:hypothetical protein